MFRILLVSLLAMSPAVAQADAAQTYQLMCATCHGPKGAGDGAAAAALPQKPASFATKKFWESRTEADVAKVIKEGGAAVGKSPLMAPFGTSLTDDQIKKLVAYLKTLKTEE